MKFRKTRIIFASFCAIFALLLIVLWISSFWRCVSFNAWVSSNRLITLNSFAGYLEIQNCKGAKAPDDDSPAIRLSYAEVSPDNAYYFWNRRLPRNWLAIGCMRDSVVPTYVFPHWLVVLLTGSLAAAGVLPIHKWRFSLRTLLIFTTLISLALGLIIYFVKT